MKEKSQAQKDRRKSIVKGGNKGSNTSVFNNDILQKLEQTGLENMAESDREDSQE